MVVGAAAASERHYVIRPQGHPCMRAQISFDLIMEDNMEFVEGTYRLLERDWHVFIFGPDTEVTHPVVRTEVRRMVETYVEQGPYPGVWVLPRDPNQNWDYTFLGGDARTQAVPEFREMVRAIAEGISVPCFDDDDGSRDTVEGYVRCDSDQGEREEWNVLTASSRSEGGSLQANLPRDNQPLE